MLPHTLHGQLFLLTFDRRRQRLCTPHSWRFFAALRTAMLSDLYLRGHLADHGRAPHRTALPCPTDPVLAAAADAVVEHPRMDWAHLTVIGTPAETTDLVRRQLEGDGWLQAEQRRVLGFGAAISLRPRAPEAVDRLAQQVITTLHGAIADQAGDQRLLALGLLAMLGQLSTVLAPREVSHHREKLEILVAQAIPPIVGLREAVLAVEAGRYAAAHRSEHPG